MLKIKLPKSIADWREGQSYLTLLFNNGLSYHCEDSAVDILWNLPEDDTPSEEEELHMDKLMDEIYALPEFENYPNIEMCPCGFVLDLQKEKDVQTNS